MAKKAGFLQFKLRGIQKVKKSLQDKVKKVKAGLRKATRQGAAVIQAEAKSLVKVRTGTLKKGIIVRRPKSAKRGQVIYQVAFKPTAFYGRFVELGHKSRSGGTVSPHPFLIPAFDLKKEQAAKVILDFVTKEVTTKD